MSSTSPQHPEASPERCREASPTVARAAAKVVVIGAGLGGLAAGLTLARRGLAPLVLEQHNVPGGCATSFVRGRFEFEPSLHEMANVGPPEAPGRARTILEGAGVTVEMVPVPEAYRLILTEQGIDHRLPFGLDAFAEAVGAAAPGTGAAVRRYLQLVTKVCEAMDYLQRKGRHASKLHLLLHHGDFIRTAPYSVDEVADACGLPASARALVYPYWCYLGVPMSRLSFTIWALMLHVYLRKGGYVPRLRSHALSAAVARRIRELGGEVRLGTRATRILLDADGHVCGVETAGGERIACRRVISNAPPAATYDGLLGGAFARAVEAQKLERARAQGSTAFVVYLGLDAPPEALGLTDYSYFIAPHMNTDVLYAATRRREPPLMQAAVCLNRAVPDCSPPGTTILSLTALYDPDAWRGLDARTYAEEKSRIAAAMIAQFESATHVSVRPHIEEIEIAGPATFARYLNASEGRIYGYEPEPWDSLVPRALATAHERFVPGLHLCGGHGAFLHGYSSSLASGQAAAEQCAAEMETAV